MSLNDPAYVERQYQREDRLAARSSVWREGGQEAWCVALDAIRTAGPARVLDIGCGERVCCKGRSRDKRSGRRERYVAADGEAGGRPRS